MALIWAGVRFGFTSRSKDATPLTIAVEKLVPNSEATASSFAGPVRPRSFSDRMPSWPLSVARSVIRPPGADTVTNGPKLLYWEANCPVFSEAPTLITPAQLAGMTFTLSFGGLLLPAATTTVAPRSTTSLIAS